MILLTAVERTMHKGIDFAGKEGVDVIAHSGWCRYMGWKMFGYGELVEIDHGNGLRTRYGHNKVFVSKCRLVMWSPKAIQLPKWEVQGGRLDPMCIMKCCEVDSRLIRRNMSTARQVNIKKGA